MDYSDDPRKEVAAYLADVNFDSVVVITLDRHTELMSNWYYFSGHPSTWGSSELSDVAKQMAALTVENLKSDVNAPSSRPVKVKYPKIEYRSAQNTDNGWIRLGAIGFGVKKGMLWFQLHCIPNEFGFWFRWGAKENGYRYLDLFIGLVLLSISFQK